MPTPILAVVDDDRGMSSLLRDIARKEGFEVLVYNSGIDFQFSLATPPEVLVLDLMMPDIDGIEIIRALGNRGTPTRIILISGHESSILQAAQRLAKAHNLNVAGCFGKPLDIQKFRALLQTLRFSGTTGGLIASNAAKAVIDVNALRIGIRESQLLLHYQPQSRIRDNRICGVEALVRWQHPTLGLLAPDTFIALAEQNGLIDDLTGFVIREAISQSQAWRKIGINLPISVNISADNITSVVLPDQLTDLVGANQLDPSSLVLEMTETALMGELVKSLDILTRLRMRGFDLSIDDFGTGYSSLQQLHRLPFTELKIDKEFVILMDQEKEARAIVESCAMLGRKLNMNVVAEGVDSASKLESLKQMGCDVAQGFFIAEPMTADQFVTWLRSRRQVARPALSPA